MHHGKIFDLKDAAIAADQARAAGRNIVLCHGVFDLFHVGHLRHLAVARSHGDMLVVSITADAFVNKGPDRPAFPAELRAEVLASLEIVDMVIVIHHPSASPAIETVKPAVYVKGGEYADAAKDITGKIVYEQELVERFGGRVVFTHDITFSSSNILNSHFNVLDKPARAYLDTVKEAGGEAMINGFLDKIAQMRVLIIGETIIDHYQYVAPMGKAAKENIIATLHQGEEFFAGGVIAAANHLASLCPNVEMITILGDPNEGENFQELVNEKLADGIKVTLFHRPNGPTIQKTRFVEPTYVRKLFEVYRMDDRPLPADIRAEIRDAIVERLDKVDLVIVCDFGHGFLDAETIRILEKRAPFLAINAQSNAGNIGYNVVTKYRRADLVCIDAMEARLAAKDKHANLPELVTSILPEAVNCPNFIVTHGKEGCFTSGGEDGDAVHIPSFTRNVVDTVGAGDAFFVTAAPFLAAGAPCQIAGFAGNIAGAIKVSIIGHKTNVSKIQLQRYITTIMK